jgi:hypothetical protein
MKKTTKVWIGVGAFVLVSGPLAAETAPVFDRNDPALRGAASYSQVAQSGERGGEAGERGGERGGEAGEKGGEAGGEGGEGGQAGTGGEAGINVGAASRDPVEYGIALQVIAAHYYAGLAAYEGKETDAGAQMFAHGMSEVYVEMEDVFKRRGAKSLGPALEAAVAAAVAKKPAADVRKRVNAVMKALAAAEKVGPKASGAREAVKAKVVADMLNRAAAQYKVSLSDKTLEPYLDGLGFAVAARTEAAKIASWLRKKDRKKAQAVSEAVKLASRAYPGINRPKTQPVEPGDFLAAASTVQFAVANLK